MTRRSAYLMAWGVAYLFLGFLFVVTKYSPIWGWLFGGAGVICLFGAITRKAWIDTVSFTFLSMTAAAKAAWYVVQIILVGFESRFVFTVVIWGSVAVAQTVASGFEDTPKVIVEGDWKQSAVG